MTDETRIRLTGLWAHTSKSGQTYWTGRLGAGKLIAFENRNKRNDKDPDITLFLTEDDQGKQAPRSSNNRGSGGNRGAGPVKNNKRGDQLDIIDGGDDPWGLPPLQE